MMKKLTARGGLPSFGARMMTALKVALTIVAVLKIAAMMMLAKLADQMGPRITTTTKP